MSTRFGRPPIGLSMSPGVRAISFWMLLQRSMIWPGLVEPVGHPLDEIFRRRWSLAPDERGRESETTPAAGASVPEVDE
jgi:hypothetical protein